MGRERSGVTAEAPASPTESSRAAFQSCPPIEARHRPLYPHISQDPGSPPRGLTLGEGLAGCRGNSRGRTQQHSQPRWVASALKRGPGGAPWYPLHRGWSSLLSCKLLVSVTLQEERLGGGPMEQQIRGHWVGSPHKEVPSLGP